MKDSKLVETLRTLSLVDLIEIQKLLSTDVLLKGTVRRESALLFDHLIRYFPTFDHASIEKKAALAQLFNDSSGKINKLEKIMSTLLTAIEYYIINFVANTEFAEIRSNLTLAKYYRQQGLSHRGDIFVKRLNEYFNNNAGLSIAHYYWYGQYLEEIGDGNTLKNSSGNEIIEKLLVNNKIYEMTINLDTLSKVVYSRTTFDNYTTQVFERLSRKIENDDICKNNILVQLYSLALKMLQNINEDENMYYEKYKNLLAQSLSHINTESAKVLFTFQRSYTIQRYNRNPNEENTREYSRVYREHLDLGYLIVNGILSPNIVINLVLLAVKEKNGEWLHSFIQKWQNFIGTPTERTEILNFCWANYYFIVKDFDKAEDCISFNYQSVNYLLYTRRMRLKILFEKQEFLSLSYETDAFKVYVFRQYKKKEIGEEAYNSNNIFADFIKQLDTLVHNPNAKKKEKVNEKIIEKKSSEKEWLLEKIKNIKS